MSDAENPRRSSTILGRAGGHPAEPDEAGAGAAGEVGEVEAAGAMAPDSPTAIDLNLLDEVSDQDGDEGDESGPTRLRPVPWTIVAIASLAVIALLFALLGLQQRNRLQHDRNQTRELKQVSGQLVGALTTYDYQHLEQWRTAVLTHATGSFRNSFNDRFSGVSQLLTGTHNRATSTVQGIFVGDVQAGRATTLVIVDVTVTGLSGTRRVGSYDKLTVLNVNGHWQVDDIESLNFDPTTAGSPGTGTTATTLPGAAPAPVPTTTPGSPSK
jgi:hypothetical protein